MIETLLQCLALKHVDRAGWRRVGVERPESVAAHSWGVAWLTLLTLPEGLDLQRALTYALLHDLAEAWTGDLTPHDGVSREEKLAAERRALERTLPQLPRGTALLAAWEAYEAQQDAESRFVRQLDRLDMGLQARIYRQAGADTTELRDSARSQLTEAPLLAYLLDNDPAESP